MIPLLALPLSLCLLAKFPPEYDDLGRKFYHDNTSGHTSVCEVHSTQMTRQPVGVRGYGLICPTHYPPYPHAPWPADSGCLSPAQAEYAIVWVCSDCTRIWYADTKIPAWLKQTRSRETPEPRR